MLTTFGVDDMNPNWPLDYFETHPAYAPLLPLIRQLRYFPNYADWDQLLPKPSTRSGLPLCFVDPATLTHSYEIEIAQSGCIATRLANWHDMFNALVWHTFAQIKAALNALHAREMQTGSTRGPIRDAATLFDECGLIVAACDPMFFELQHEHQWPALFNQRRYDWGSRIEVLSVGHANYEALLAPFVGLTGKCWQITVPLDYFTLSLAERISYLDRCIAELIDAGELRTPRQLPPLPYLGIPGWWPEQNDAFYANTDYFRPKFDKHKKR